MLLSFAHGFSLVVRAMLYGAGMLTAFIVVLLLVALATRLAAKLLDFTSRPPTQ
jgi:hypothetical protein